MSFLSSIEQMGIIKRGTEEIISEKELLYKLEDSKEKNIPLRIKAGFDPTAPDLHFGHCVLLRKLRQFQDLGHTVVFIVGDFTAIIGDPSGRSETRPPLTEDQVLKNAKTYQDQVFKILRKDRCEVVFNSKWLNKLGAAGLLELAGLGNVARMLERDDFSKRYENGISITIKEFLYPLIQAYDSVCIESDVEFGGTDQTFNILMGRDLQRAYNQKPQVAILLPILEGLDGVKKMSKSLGNYISIKDSPEDIYGKVMSINDEIMWKYYKLLTDYDDLKIKSLKAEDNPLSSKKLLAHLLTSWIYDYETAESAQSRFESRFSAREFPEDAEEVRISREKVETILDLVSLSSKRIRSRADAKRIIAQGGVSIDGEKYMNINDKLPLGETLNVKIGKREFIKVIVD